MAFAGIELVSSGEQVICTKMINLAMFGLSYNYIFIFLKMLPLNSRMITICPNRHYKRPVSMGETVLEGQTINRKHFPSLSYCDRGILFYQNYRGLAHLAPTAYHASREIESGWAA